MTQCPPKYAPANRLRCALFRALFLTSPFFTFGRTNPFTAAVRLLETAGEKRWKWRNKNLVSLEAREVMFLCYYLLILNLSYRYLKKLKSSPSGLLALCFSLLRVQVSKKWREYKSSVNIASSQKLESSPTKAEITAENESETESTDTFAILQSRRFTSLLSQWNAKSSTAPLPLLVKRARGAAVLPLRHPCLRFAKE